LFESYNLGKGKIDFSESGLALKGLMQINFLRYFQGAIKKPNTWISFSPISTIIHLFLQVSLVPFRI